MKGIVGLISLFLIIALPHVVPAQCPSPSFNLPATACREQNLTLDNQSTAGTFQWDYCSGDLDQSPTAAATFVLAGANGRPNFEYVKDGDRWYAFATGTFSNRLFRIDYGNDPAQVPVLIENLGDLGGKLNGPGAVRFVQSNGNWFGLLHNTNTGELLKLSFGNSLGNAITVTSLFTGIGGINAGLAVAHDGANGWVCVISTTSNNYQVIRLGENLAAPTPSDILITSAVPNPNNLFDVDLIRMCDEWYAFSNNLGNGNIYRLSFGTTLFQQPTIDQVGDLGGLNGGRLRAMKDGEQYYLAVATLGGDFYKVSLGNDLANLSVVPDNEGTFSSLLQNSIAVGVAFHNSTWSISVVDASSGQVTSVKYPNNCTAVELHNENNSPVIRYTQQGTYNVSLTMTNASGISSTVTESVVVGPLQSPDIDIHSQNVCAGHDVMFSAESVAGGIDTYDWAFGDATTNSNDPSPVHVYATSGLFLTSLNVHSPNGCTNSAQKEVKIYDPPVADFSLPSGLVCTNNEHVFTTNTPDNFDGLLQYAWTVDGIAAGSARDLSQTFTTTGDKDVVLGLTIPGCSDEQLNTINNVESGPTVGFSTTGQCEDSAYSFNNQSTGSIASYSWDFDDGETSADTNPDHVFDDGGTYTVTLNTTGTNGCVSTTSQPIDVYTRPLPSFVLDLPPFSCAGSPSQFHDTTPPPADSNVSQWDWAFGDNQSGTGKDPTHVYSVAGEFGVRLTVTTDKGCTAFQEQPVTISGSPTASFVSDPACLNKPTRFTDLSTGDIESWQWKIGNQVYTVEDPVHQFAATGNFSAQLIVTGTNDCVSTLTKPVLVPVVPTMDFNVTNACSGQATVFNDLTLSPGDPVAQTTWSSNTTIMGTTPQVDFTFASAGTYPVKLEVTNQSGCMYSLTRQVPINVSPVANFTTSVESGPPPLNVSFTNTSTGASSYQWNFDDGSAVKTEPSQEHTFSALGDYDVSLTATGAQGCTATMIKLISVIIPYDELALEEFSLVSSGTTYRGYLRVHNLGNYRISGFRVTYDVGGGFLLTENVTASLNPGQTSMILLSNTFTSPAPAGYICAELQSDTNLSDNKACTVLNDAPVVLAPYSNPTDALLTVETIQPSAGTVRIHVYNSSGGSAYDKTFDVAAGLSRLTLDVQNLSPGIYVVVISAGNDTSSRRILISR